MSTQEIGLIISILALVVSILGTLGSLLYSKKRMKIMEEQLSIYIKSAQRKTNYEEISAQIRKSITEIKEHTDFQWYYSIGLDFTQNDILNYIHDNKLKTLELTIQPENFQPQINDLNSLKEVVKGLIQKDSRSGTMTIGSITFNMKFDPSIVQNEFLDLVDPFSSLYYLYNSLERLLVHREVIDVFDNTILDELAETIDNISETIFRSLMSEHKIIIDASKTSRYIYQELHRKLLNFDSVEKLLIRLSSEICERLSKVQKEVFLAS